ncbi:uncharacterized protein LOC143474673 isoform X2 [Brachyhypopomus gauderio]|uniref:uncharacterized protein LOC143474673 isoform X2 n=1 Tax=Brachyhypopomus gauderio TaxID=698409 RepID=UPI00404119CC
MGLKVLLVFLGLQLCLFCPTRCTDAGSHAALQLSRPDRGHKAEVLLAEVPPFRMGLNYMAPKDSDVVVKKYTRVRRQTKKKKKKPVNPGAMSVLAISLPVAEEKTPIVIHHELKNEHKSRVRRQTENKKKKKKNHGALSAIAQERAPDLEHKSRVRQQTEKKKKKKKKTKKKNSGAMSVLTTNTEGPRYVDQKISQPQPPGVADEEILQ